MGGNTGINQSFAMLLLCLIWTFVHATHFPSTTPPVQTDASSRGCGAKLAAGHPCRCRDSGFGVTLSEARTLVGFNTTGALPCADGTGCLADLKDGLCALIESLVITSDVNNFTFYQNAYPSWSPTSGVQCPNGYLLWGFNSSGVGSTTTTGMAIAHCRSQVYFTDPSSIPRGWLQFYDQPWNASGVTMCLPNYGVAGIKVSNQGLSSGDLSDISAITCALPAQPICQQTNLSSNAKRTYSEESCKGNFHLGCSFFDICDLGYTQSKPDTAVNYTCFKQINKFGLSPPGVLICTNINECERSCANQSDSGCYTCPTQSVCVDTIGSYECICNSGYSGANCTSKNYCNKNCVGGLTPETDECHDCPRWSSENASTYDAICSPLPGSFTCLCPPGFRGTGANVSLIPCVQINECFENTDNCSRTANGTRQEGVECFDSTPDPHRNTNFFTCGCKVGFFSPSPNVCNDVDECAVQCGPQVENPLVEGCHTCDLTRSNCSNQIGQPALCPCLAGFNLNGTSGICEEVDECANNTCGLPMACLNLINNYECMPVITAVTLITSSTNQSAPFTLSSTSQISPDRVLITIKPPSANILWDGNFSYGSPLQAKAYRAKCVSLNVTSFLCTLVPGAGANLTFSLSACLLTPGYPQSCPTITTVNHPAFRFSYPPPTLTGGSLCTYSGTCGSFINASYAGIITMNGTNLVDTKNIIQVTFMSFSGNRSYNCDVQTATFTSLSCVPENVFTESNFRFFVSIGADSSSQIVEGTDRFNLVSGSGAAVISIVPVSNIPGGCERSGAGIANCPCIGEEIISVSIDTALLDPATATFRVDGEICRFTSLKANATIFNCSLPSGVGDRRPVFMTIDGSKVGPSSNLVSYQAPVVTNILVDPSVKQCKTSPTNSLMLYDCPRTNGGKVYLKGRNFGRRGATILTNFQNIPAEHLGSLFNQPFEANGIDRYLSFDLPNGTGTQTVVVFQQNGKGSTVEITYSYQKCSPGTFLANLTCIDCPPGSFSTSEGSIVCSKCNEGFYQPNPGRVNCLSCPVGRAANTTGVSNCTLCDLGYYASNTSFPSCLPCSPGKIASSPGSATCTECGVGTIAEANAASACTNCLRGKIASSNGLSVCSGCEAGKFVATDAHYECYSCLAGRYQSLTNQSDCVDCPLGKYTDQFQAKQQCYNCPAGSYALLTGKSCAPCERGRFQDGLSPSTSCTNCSIGTVAFTPGLSACVPCEAGRYMNSTGESVCTACTPGYYISSATPLKLGCLPCAPGKFSPGDASPSCTNCAPGFYQPAENASICEACERGRHVSTPGSTGCVNCTKGFSQPVLGQAECAPCAAGLYTADTAVVQCSACPPGYSSLLQGTECYACPAGKYLKEPGKPTCLPCEPGTFGTELNATTCKSCDAGSFASTPGSTSCSFCAAGKISAPGKSVCSDCSGGQYASNPGQTGCYDCPTNSRVNKLFAACACPVGSFSISAPKTTGLDNYTVYTCVECRTGFVCIQEGLPSERLVESPGYWRPEGSSDADLTIYRCVNPSLCLGARQCQPNRMGPLCALCQPGYKASGPAGECGLCPADNGQTWGYTVGIVILIIFLLCIFYYVVLKVSSSQQLKLEKLAAMKDEQTIQEIEELQKEFAVDDAYFEAERAQYAKAQEIDTNEEAEDLQTTGGEEEPTVDDERRLAKAMSDRAVIAAQGPESYKNPIFLASGGGGRSSVAHIVRPGEKAMSDEIVNEGSTFRLKHLSMASRRAPNFMYKVKILVGFFQIASIMPLQGEIAWPTAYTAFISAFSILNFDFIPWQSLTCATKIDYFGRAMLVGCIPIVVVLALVLFFYVPMYIRDLDSITDQLRKQHKRNLRNRQFIRLLLFTVFLLYPFVSKVVLGVYNCITVERVSYLVADFELRCFDSNWSTYAGIAVIFVLLYPVGIPLIYYFILRRSYGHLHEPAVILQFGFLYEAYTDQRWYWELIDLVHKLILTSIVVFAPSSAILGVNMFIICAYMIMILLFHPYIRKGDDRFHLLTQTELFLLALVGYIIQRESIVFANDPDMDALLSACLILIVLFLVLSFIVIAGRNIQKIWIHAKAKKLAKQIQAANTKPVREIVEKTPEVPKPRPAALEL